MEARQGPRMPEAVQSAHGSREEVRRQHSPERGRCRFQPSWATSRAPDVSAGEPEQEVGPPVRLLCGDLATEPECEELPGTWSLVKTVAAPARGLGCRVEAGAEAAAGLGAVPGSESSVGKVLWDRVARCRAVAGERKGQGEADLAAPCFRDLPPWPRPQPATPG